MLKLETNGFILVRRSTTIFSKKIHSPYHPLASTYSESIIEFILKFTAPDTLSTLARACGVSHLNHECFDIPSD